MTTAKPQNAEPPAPAKTHAAAETAVKTPAETGGPKGLEPTRYGDWESKGRCVDF